MAGMGHKPAGYTSTAVLFKSPSLFTCRSRTGFSARTGSAAARSRPSAVAALLLAAVLSGIALLPLPLPHVAAEASVIAPAQAEPLSAVAEGGVPRSRWRGVASALPAAVQPPGAVTFSANSNAAAVEYNPSGDVAALLAHDLGATGEAVAGFSSPSVATTASAPTDADLALRDLLLSKRLPYDPTQPYKLPEVSYSDADFLFATGSHPERYVMAQASRSWRLGVRAFIAVNNTDDVPILNERNKAHGERYGYFPDDGSGELGPRFHGNLRGDSRAALAPFLAHEAFGETYKWVLYGDDDTVFFMPAVKRLVAHLDPELPHAITDNLWLAHRHPHFLAPRCLPCHLAVDADPAPAPEAAAAAGVAAGSEHAQHHRRPARIPGLAELMESYGRHIVGARNAAEMASPEMQRRMADWPYQAFNKTQQRINSLGLGPGAMLPGLRYAPRPACPFCTTRAACAPPPPAEALPLLAELPGRDKLANTTAQAAGTEIGAAINGLVPGCPFSGAHGGAGVLLSVGLLRRLSLQRMTECVKRMEKATGGDALLSVCLWVAGYAYTDPGSSTLGGYDLGAVAFAPDASLSGLRSPMELVLNGTCNTHCRWALHHVVSLHGRNGLPTFTQVAASFFQSTASYAAVHKWIAFMAQQRRDAVELEGLLAAVGLVTNGQLVLERAVT